MSASSVIPPLSVGVVPPLPRHRPGYAPPPTPAQRTDPRDPCNCPLHDPAAPHTRNSAGAYSTFAPACSGCYHGDRDTRDLAIANRVYRLETDLLAALAAGHPTQATADLADQLREATQTLDATAPDLFSVCYAGRRAFQYYEHTVRLHAVLQTHATPIVAADIHERLDNLQNAVYQYSTYVSIYGLGEAYTGRIAIDLLDQENLTYRRLMGWA
jgi:hypothetical protein